jgi:subtilisin family serine protease
VNTKLCPVSLRALAGWALAILFWVIASSGARARQTPYREDRILIQPKPGISPAALANFHRTQKCAVLRTFDRLGRLQVLSVPKGEEISALIAKYQESGLVEFAEPDYLVCAAATMPNDPYYTNSLLWGLYNYGQSGGTPGADIGAPDAWDVRTSANNIVVAVLDSGIRYTHEDLAANMWINPIDGGPGYNAFTGTNDPSDDNGHGTRMAGVLGAAGNNGKGVVGVAWQVQIMACKCLTNTASGNAAGGDSDLVACIDYACANGAKIINASLGGPNFSLAVSNAIVSARDAGIILVTAAGNSTPPNPGVDIDAIPFYPASYQIDNIIPVAYTTRTDALGPYSNFGATMVALGAPGDQIYSTVAASDTAYTPEINITIGKESGTSFAAAYVSGACALLMAQYPADNYREIISRLLNSTDPLPALAGKCRTGGRLNLRKALRTISVATVPVAAGEPFQLRVDGGLIRTCVVQATTNLTDWSPIYTNTTSTNGTFVFTNQSPDLPQNFFRATAEP